MVRKRKKLSSRNQKSDLPGQENTSCGATLLDSLTIRSVYTLRYIGSYNGEPCRRLYILSRGIKFPVALESPFTHALPAASHRRGSL